jgi:hypothetical protein
LPFITNPQREWAGAMKVTFSWHLPGLQHFDNQFEKSGWFPLFFDSLLPSVNILHTHINIVQDNSPLNRVRLII